MDLGAFSLSLNVKDIQVSKEFYEKLGFKIFGGDINQNWLIMKSQNCTIGLFQGMFEKNILTFNPGWSDETKELKDFTDVRDIQKHLQHQGIKIDVETKKSSNGPAHCIIHDPDGNLIMFDQHVS